MTKKTWMIRYEVGGQMRLRVGMRKEETARMEEERLGVVWELSAVLTTCSM